ncbi:hypothetical protein PHYSODRAFT_299010 [Phytophthora sojae]|uniref:RNase H type-1 domain-containing protein n=1 Tax=Phytophthora sojae (strain P6497) TaxID=1094619 RepID=G4ZA20_PHYSP|nr:hypothetical protein PHYSODRAFT_299010 [Phytophthora sojae]EGZ21159.1 hypothetical protein PHYSODRAFT_299010 [Phytophthora sojae]|eukprot:XP_009523876.1 hypothetical protein PHYSODRAFT_299010 [Phytophthora sojae]
MPTSFSTLQPLIMSFDGGARGHSDINAYACCVWSDDNTLMSWAARSVLPGGTNNEMEAQGLLTGLPWLYQHHKTSLIRVIGDSEVIIQLALGTQRVRSPNLVPALREI